MPETGYKKIDSKNYSFFVPPGSLAEKDIASIAAIQEKCFVNVCRILRHPSILKINFYFFTDPQSCGASYDVGTDPEKAIPRNAFCYYPNSIHATYNAEIKAVGHHEVAHLLLYEKLKCEPHLMLNEGFAVYCDDSWAGFDLDTWAAYIVKNNFIDIDKIFRDVPYFQNHSYLAYPVMGSYCKRRIQSRGLEDYLELLKKPRLDDAFCRVESEEYARFLDGIPITQKEELKFREAIEAHFGKTR